MFELFVVGTFWFWMLLAAEIALLFMFVEYENGFGATVSVLVFGAALQLMGGVDILGFLYAHPIKVVALVAAYFALGAIWGVVKWWIFCSDKLREYEEFKSEFLKDNGHAGAKVVPEDLRAKFKRCLVDHAPWKGGCRRDLSQAPLVKEHKARVLRWMTFWWVSLIWSLINDFVKRLFREIYNRIAAFLQHISDAMFNKAGVDADLAEPTKDKDPVE